MAFVAAICPACGGQLQLDDSLEKGFCQYCGTQIIVQDAIHGVKIEGPVQVMGISTLETELRNVSAYIKLGKLEDARTLLKQLTKQYTGDYRPWWEYAKINAQASNFYSKYIYYDTITSSEAYDAALKLADEKQRLLIMDEYNAYKLRIEQTKEKTSRIIDEISRSGDYSLLNHIYTKCTRRWSEQSRVLESIRGYELINGKLYEYEPQTVGNDEYSYRYTGKFDFSIVKGIQDQCLVSDREFLTKHRHIVVIEDDVVVFSFIDRNVNTQEMMLIAEWIYTRAEDTPPEVKQSVELIKQGAFVPDKKSSGGGCYIATAVYGSYDAPEVMVLRHYRDTVLAETWYGRAFIKAYYLCSPPIANWLKDATRINSVVRRWLNAIVNKLQEM